MSVLLEQFLAVLRAHGCGPRRSGSGWSARCPAHDDRSPSLSVAEGEDGRLLVHCHAGCAPDAVWGAVGWRASDLFAPADRRDGRALHRPGHRDAGDGMAGHPGPAGIPSPSPVPPRTRARVCTSAREAQLRLERERGRPSACWTYTNAAAEPVGLVLRWDTPTGKTVRPVSRTADGSGWYIGGMPTPRPLYGLPELLAAPPGSRVYVVEGEKAAEAARAAGLTATTSPQGAKAAAKADWSPLRGRHVVLSPDRDEAGEGFARHVARLAMAAGAASVRIVRLADLWADMPKGGDMADFLDHRGGDAERVRAEVEALADAAGPAAAAGAPPGAGFAPFPVDVLPEPARSFVAGGARAIGCDPSYVALPLLSALAAAIGNTRRIALKRGWAEPAIVWTAIVGESGTAKSPALELALRPVRERQRDAMRRHAEATRAHEGALAVHERDAAQWKRSRSDEPPPARPEAPVAERCWTDDVTTEALAVLLQQNPRGLLMVKDELAGWFSFDRYAGGKGGGDAAKWLEMFGGRPMVVDRKTGGTLYVHRAAVSIAGGIQPETLRRALGQEHRDNGLAARLLLACPPRRPKRWTEAEVDAGTQAAVAAVFERLYALEPETGEDGDPRPRLVTLAGDGKAAWVRFYDEHAREQAELSGDEAAAWSKLEGYAARLALVVHLARWAAGDPSLADASLADEASVAAGVVLARWFGREARRVYGILAEGDGERESRQLVEWIERRGGAVTVRELTRGPRAYRDAERAEEALRGLAAAGLGTWEVNDHGGGRGRPAERFRLRPPGGDTGDGDANAAAAGPRRDSVAAGSADGGGWGEL